MVCKTIFDEFSRKWTAQTALQVALFLLVKDKGSSVPFFSVGINFMAQTADGRNFISFISRRTTSKGGDGAIVSNGSTEKMTFS